MIDDLPLDEIYDYDSEVKERADWEIEALERKEQVENERDEIIERQVNDEIERKEKRGRIEEADREVREEIARMRHMNESLKKIHEIMGLPKA